MKNILYLLIITVSVACSNAQKPSDNGWDITVSGKVNFPKEKRKIQIQELTSAGNPKTDSATVNADGTYSKKIHLTEPGYYRFNFYDQQFVDLVLDKSNIELNVDGNDQQGNIEIKGSPDYDLLRNVSDQLVAFNQQPNIQEIQAKFQEASQKQQESMANDLRDQYFDLMEKNRDEIIKGLESKPVSLGMINLLEGTTFDSPTCGCKDHFYPYYKKFADAAIAKMPTSIHIQNFRDMVQKMGITAVGAKAPEISLPDANGKVITLSSFKGKYVLIDFWAKWCGPCRRENPNVVKAYNEFKGKDFDILGVSLDRSKEDWVQAIEQDGLKWTHVSDLKYFESQAAIDYGVNAIPFSVLVDPNGVIVAKNLRGPALQKKLHEVLKK